MSKLQRSVVPCSLIDKAGLGATHDLSWHPDPLPVPHAVTDAEHPRTALQESYNPVMDKQLAALARKVMPLSSSFEPAVA